MSITFTKFHRVTLDNQTGEEVWIWFTTCGYSTGQHLHRGESLTMKIADAVFVVSAWEIVRGKLLVLGSVDIDGDGTLEISTARATVTHGVPVTTMTFLK